ncbi:hypothetical protein [Opitutus terrae]|uniref:hypothetical protein n=1 Tax=Opitutus terrae TaxID=107709 RepID=UPI0002E733EC|nr:hypothetical protein [Opitutus terrae]
MKANSTTITKEQFVAILRDSGITDAQMGKLHQLFEQRHPEAHEAFLRFLQIDEAEAKAIRARSR